MKVVILPAGYAGVAAARRVGVEGVAKALAASPAFAVPMGSKSARLSGAHVPENVGSFAMVVLSLQHHGSASLFRAGKLPALAVKEPSAGRTLCS